MTPANREEQVREALERLDRWAVSDFDGECKMADDYATIRAHIEALEANDRRYRWLRDEENQDAHEMYVLLERLIPAYLTADDLDAAIDSAMQGEEVRG